MRIPVISQPAHVDLLRAALQQITDHPETWDQSNFCGTACCLYGHIVQLAGLEVRGERSVGLDVYDAHGSLLGDVVVVVDRMIGLSVSQLSEEQRAWLEAVQEEFGGEELWLGDHTISTLWAYAEALTAGAITPPPGIADYTHPVYAKIHAGEYGHDRTRIESGLWPSS